MKSRFTHLALLALGAAALVLSYLAMIPKYAAFAGGALLLVADARKALAKPSDTAVVNGIFVLFFGMVSLHALYGCAHLVSSAKSCAATSLQAQQILNQLGNPAQAAALAGLDSLKFAECVIASEIDDYIAAHQDDAGARALAESDPLDGVRMRNAMAWKAAHP